MLCEGGAIGWFHLGLAAAHIKVTCYGQNEVRESHHLVGRGREGKEWVMANRSRVCRGYNGGD